MNVLTPDFFIKIYRRHPFSYFSCIKGRKCEGWWHSWRNWNWNWHREQKRWYRNKLNMNL